MLMLNKPMHAPPSIQDARERESERGEISIDALSVVTFILIYNRLLHVIGVVPSLPLYSYHYLELRGSLAF